MYVQAAGYVLSLFVLLLSFLYRKQFQTFNTRRRVQWPAVTFGSLALIIGFWIRIGYINSVSGGHYMFEELSASLIYIAGILNLKHTLTGATNIVFFLGNAAWQFLLGPFLPSIRALSGLVGAVGILFLYLGLKRLTDRNSALLASGMAAMSVYGSYFSRVAVETGWPLTFFSINLYLYSHLTGKKKNFFTIFLLGLSTVMGVFTYPGYTLWLVAISPFLFFQFAKTRNFRMILPYAAGILIFFIPATFSKLQIG